MKRINIFENLKKDAGNDLGVNPLETLIFIEVFQIVIAFFILLLRIVM